jgi:hypothetical protein
MLQVEPDRHSEVIDEIVRTQLGLTSGSFAPPKPQINPLPKPVDLREPPRQPQSSSVSLNQTGSNGFQLAAGDISGGFNFTSGAAAPAQKRPELSQIDDDLPDADSPIRILFLGANPDDSVRLRLDQEVREIDRALASATLGHRFQLYQKWAVRSSELQSHLLRCKPQILHFSGHGSREKGIILEADDGADQAVDGPRLARLLGQFNQNLRCVVLNACYSEEQAHAIAQEVDCVIGMATAVEDTAAIRFAAVFYEALAYGSDVRAAYELGRADVVVGEMGQDAVPQLIVRRRAAETIRFAPPALP